MPNQRGFVSLIQLAIYVGLFLAVAGVIGAAYHSVKQAGVNEERVRNEANSRLARERLEKQRIARQAIANQTVAALQQAERQASDYEAKYREARKSRRNVPLAECAKPQPRPENVATAIPASPDGGIRLTPAFVLLYDAAWTGRGGQPVFPDTGNATGGTPSAGPVEPDAVLETHAENASRCSKNSRQLSELIGLIRKFQGRK